MFKNKDKLMELVRKCVNDYDPEQLLSVSYPDDEYEPEIKAIAESLMPGASRTEIWLIVCNTLHWFFGSHDEPVLYWRKHLELADSILHILPEVDAVSADAPAKEVVENDAD